MNHQNQSPSIATKNVEKSLCLTSISLWLTKSKQKKNSKECLLEDCLVCKICRKCFHKDCANIFTESLPRSLPGESCYSYSCSGCNEGKESFSYLDKVWVDIVELALYNLWKENKRQSYRFYDVTKEIIPYIEKNISLLSYPGKTCTSLSLALFSS